MKTFGEHGFLNLQDNLIDEKRGQIGPFFYCASSLLSSNATVNPAITIRIAPIHCHIDMGSPRIIFADKAATISSESIKIPIKPGARY